jgi:hypothetical protein
MEGKIRWEFKFQFLVGFILATSLFLYLMYYSDWTWRFLIFLTFIPLVFIKHLPEKITILDGYLYLNKASSKEKKYSLKADIESINTDNARFKRGPNYIRGFEELAIYFKDGSNVKFSQNEFTNYLELKNAIYKEWFYDNNLEQPA